MLLSFRLWLITLLHLRWLRLLFILVGSLLLTCVWCLLLRLLLVLSLRGLLVGLSALIPLFHLHCQLLVDALPCSSARLNLLSWGQSLSAVSKIMMFRSTSSSPRVSSSSASVTVGVPWVTMILFPWLRPPLLSVSPLVMSIMSSLMILITSTRSDRVLFVLRPFLLVAVKGGEVVS